MKFEEWLSQQNGVIEVDCGCVTTEAFYHWMRVAYEAGNSQVIPDGWTCNDKANAALMMLDRIETADPVDDDRIDGIKRIVRELAAAPHDTPALNSVQSVDSVADRWIPVSEQKPDCWCLTCRPVTLNDMRFVVCPDCGNKRCPRANDHRNACTGSNEPGQKGSAYPAAPQSPGSEPATVPGKWIPVSERMPDENAEQQVLACFKGGDISTLYYFEGRWDDAYGIVPIRQDVTHWMPLPAAPQEVKGE